MKIKLEVSEELGEQIKIAAELDGCTENELIINAIKNYLMIEEEIGLESESWIGDVLDPDEFEDEDFMDAIDINDLNY